MKKLLVTLGIAIALATGGGLLWQHQATVQAAQAALQALQSSTSALHDDAFVHNPGSNLAAAQLNHVAYAQSQVTRYLKVLSPKQRAQYRAAQATLAEAKVYTAVYEEAHNVLGSKQVVTDTKYSATSLTTAYAGLKEAAPVYAKAVAAKVAMVRAQVTALKQLQKAQQGATPATIAAAEAAISGVASPAFQATYLPAVKKLEPATTTPAKDTGTSDTPATQPSDSTKTDSAASSSSTTTPPADKADSSSATDAADTTTDKADSSADSSSDTATESGDKATSDASADTEEASDTEYYATKAEAEQAMAAAQAASSDPQPASVTTVTAADGTVKYTWHWVTTAP